MALHQQISGIEGLCQTHHGVVYGGISMGMVFAQYIAYDTGTLTEGLIGGKTQFTHGIQYPPVYGLQAVPHIGQRPIHDDRHGIGDKALLHLLFQMNG